MTDGRDAVVEDDRPRGLRALYRSEDYWAIWLGFALLAVGLVVFLSRPPGGMRATIARANEVLRSESEAPFKTVAWYEAVAKKQALRASKEEHARALGKFIAKPQNWTTNPARAFVLGERAARRGRTEAESTAKARAHAAAAAKTRALAAERASRADGFSDPALIARARRAVETWRRADRRADKAKKKAQVQAYHQLPFLVGLGFVLALLFGAGAAAMGRSFKRFCVGFSFVFALAVLSFAASAQTTAKELGIGYAAWAIVLGLLVSNTIGTPRFARPAVQTEYFIKTGLVLLGAEVLFSKVLSIGLPGIFVAWVVTPTVLVTSYWFGQRIVKMASKTLTITICADMSVCGVSAAIATAAACRAKKEELTLAVGLSLVFTSVMMIVMPAVIRALGMDEVLGGAWIGGTIDATGAVAAAGAFLGDRALYVAATIKMIQNVLIGVIAFGVALYFTARSESESGRRVGALEIWYRFPKFVLGFIAASLVFSAIYAALGPDAGYTMIDHGVIRGFSKTLRGWFFCLAFVSIGLATNFRELAHHFKGGKPLILYVSGQSLNLVLTLAMAYLMFRIVFPHVAGAI